MYSAILLLGGDGTRFKNNIPKQFVTVCGRPIYTYSLETLLTHSLCGEIILVCKMEFIQNVKEYVKRYMSRKILDVVPGGNSRQESVYNGLAFLRTRSSYKNIESVIIHDSARPLMNHDDLDLVTKFLKTGVDGISLATRPQDTMLVFGVAEDKGGSYYKSGQYCLIQTPQAFNFSSITKAHEQCLKLRERFSDDLQVLIAANNDYQVLIVNGRTENFKVTVAEDIKRLEKNIGGKNDG